MPHFKNNPFAYEGRPEYLSPQEFIKLLNKFESYANGDACLSVFLKRLHEQEEGFPRNHRWHIDCGSGASCSSDCCHCKISRTGKYNRNQFLDWVYGNPSYTKRGNVLTKGKNHENDK